jgi:hypothetical protein
MVGLQDLPIDHLHRGDTADTPGSRHGDADVDHEQASKLVVFL